MLTIDELDAKLSRTRAPYFYTAGLVVRLHAACDAAWKRERAA